MHKLFTEEQIQKMKRLVAVSALMAEVTGQPVEEIINANLDMPERRPPGSERGLALVGQRSVA